MDEFIVQGGDATLKQVGVQGLSSCETITVKDYHIPENQPGDFMRPIVLTSNVQGFPVIRIRSGGNQTVIHTGQVRQMLRLLEVGTGSLNTHKGEEMSEDINVEEVNPSEPIKHNSWLSEWWHKMFPKPPAGTIKQGDSAILRTLGCEQLVATGMTANVLNIVNQDGKTIVLTLSADSDGMGTITFFTREGKSPVKLNKDILDKLLSLLPPLPSGK